MAADPVNADRVYMAVGMYTQGWAGPGAFMRSDDQGNTWRVMPMANLKMGGNENGRSNGERLAIDPNQPKILYFGSRRSGLFKSTDEAENFESVGSFPVKGDENGLGISFVIFDKAMHQQAMARLKIEGDLRQALDRKEFRLVYQPIIDLTDGRVAGFESLLRWQHPEYGLTRPDVFLAIAMELGLMKSIGEWTLSEACSQLKIWQKQFPRDCPLTVSVNFSIEHFTQEQLAKVIRKAVERTGIDASSLKIEITESEMMKSPEAVSKALADIKAQHIDTCLDDFGTGYSSLSHLQQLAIRFLKIDQSFVRRLGTDDDALAIVKTIIALAHQLGRQVIAEGVEIAEHLVILRSLGCEYGQGYFFAKPLAPEDVEALLASGRRW